MTYHVKIVSRFAAALTFFALGLSLNVSLANGQTARTSEQEPAPGKKTEKTLSRQAFSQIMARFDAEYLPFIYDHYSGRAIQFRSDYDSTAVTTSHPYAVAINARQLTFPSIDEASFTLSVCGEFQRFLSFHRNPGQGYIHAAHYMNVANCLRQLWQNDHVANSAYRHITPPYLRGLCDQSHSTRPKRELCYRIASAAYSLARSGKEPITIDQRSPKKANGIARSHQGMQCLFDTQLAAALCTKSDLSPVVTSLDDFLSHTCTPADGLPEQATLPPCFYNPQ